jgi:hypothetical protein
MAGNGLRMGSGEPAPNQRTDALHDHMGLIDARRDAWGRHGRSVPQENEVLERLPPRINLSRYEVPLEQRRLERMLDDCITSHRSRVSCHSV